MQLGDLAGVVDGGRGMVAEQLAERPEVLERPAAAGVEVQGAVGLLGVEEPYPGLRLDTRSQGHRGSGCWYWKTMPARAAR